MMESGTGRKAGRACMLTVFTLLLVAIPAIGFDFYYDLNDDTLIKDIVSGAYMGAPSAYSVQLLYPLSLAISLMYKAVPDFAWYGLFLCVCQFGALILIAVRLTGIFKTAKSRMLALVIELLIFIGLFFRSIVIVQYSVTAGMCMMCAIFLFITSDNKGGKWAISLFLTVLSFMIRTEVCLMLMPFLLFAGLCKWVAEEKIFTVANFRKYFMLIGAALLFMFAALSFDMLAYRGNDWSSFRDFFDARTKLYDFYDIPDYDDNKDFYGSVGLSKESYALLENYNFALDDAIDTWLFNSIADYQKEKLNNTFGFTSRNSFKEALWLYKNRFLNNFAFTDLAVGIAYIAYVITHLLTAAKNRNIWTAFFRIMPKIVMLLLIRSVLWLYLYMADRVLGRVTVPLIMAELACIMGFMLNDICHFYNLDSALQHDNGKMGKTVKAAYLLVIFILIASFAYGFAAVKREYYSRECADKRWYALMDYCRKNKDNYYVIDVYSSTSYEGAPYSEKIFKDVDNSYKNFDYCGGWLAKSPLARRKLAGRGFRDMQSALLSRKGVFFVAAPDKDMGWIEAYYAVRGVSISCESVGGICADSGETAFLVYELKKE